jgi:hypothetical protein
MSYVRAKMINGYGPYYYLVRSEKGRQIHIAYLGKYPGQTHGTASAATLRTVGQRTPTHSEDGEKVSKESNHKMFQDSQGRIYRKIDGKWQFKSTIGDINDGWRDVPEQYQKELDNESAPRNGGKMEPMNKQQYDKWSDDVKIQQKIDGFSARKTNEETPFRFIASNGEDFYVYANTKEESKAIVRKSGLKAKFSDDQRIKNVGAIGKHPEFMETKKEANVRINKAGKVPNRPEAVHEGKDKSEKSIIGKVYKERDGDEYKVTSIDTHGVPHFSKIKNGEIQKQEQTIPGHGREWAKNESQKKKDTAVNDTLLGWLDSQPKENNEVPKKKRG